MKYRIVRRWTTKTNIATGKIVEISEDQFYIQGRNFFTAIFGEEMERPPSLRVQLT